MWIAGAGWLPAESKNIKLQAQVEILAEKLRQCDGRALQASSCGLSNGHVHLHTHWPHMLLVYTQSISVSDRQLARLASVGPHTYTHMHTLQQIYQKEKRNKARPSQLYKPTAIAGHEFLSALGIFHSF